MEQCAIATSRRAITQFKSTASFFFIHDDRTIIVTCRGHRSIWIVNFEQRLVFTICMRLAPRVLDHTKGGNVLCGGHTGRLLLCAFPRSLLSSLYLSVPVYLPRIFGNKKSEICVCKPCLRVRRRWSRFGRGNILCRKRTPWSSATTFPCRVFYRAGSSIISSGVTSLRECFKSRPTARFEESPSRGRCCGDACQRWKA